MVLFNSTQIIGMIIDNLGTYVFGSAIITGLWILLVIFTLATVMKMEFSIALLMLIPITLVLMAYAMIPPIMGGVIILLAGIVLGINWFRTT